MLDLKEILNASNHYKSEYKKPTRKSMLDPQVYPHSNNEQSTRNSSNPLKEAIDLKRIPYSHVPYIRNLPGINPSYYAKLTDLNAYEKDVDLNLNKTKKHSASGIQFKFDKKVEKEYRFSTALGDFTDSSYVFKSVPSMNDLKPHKNATQADLRKSDKNLDSEFDLGLHKSSWLRDVQRPETLRKYSMSVEKDHLAFAAFKEQEKKEPHPSNSLQQNVQFMLQIWKKAEDVDLNSIFRRDQEEELKKRRKAQQTCQSLSNQKSKNILENELVKRAAHKDQMQFYTTQASSQDKPATESLRQSVVRPPLSRQDSKQEPLSRRESVIYTGLKREESLKRIQELNKRKQSDLDISQLTNTLETIANRDVTQNQLNNSKLKRRSSVVPTLGMLIEEKRPLTPKEDQPKRPDSNVSNISNESKPKHAHLSHSTIEVLKKLSVEDRNHLVYQSANANAMNDIIKMTIQGPEISEFPLYSLANGRSQVPVKSVSHREQLVYTPGAWDKLFKSSFGNNGEIVVNLKSPKQMHHFELVLPEIQEDVVKDTGFISTPTESLFSLDSESYSEMDPLDEEKQVLIQILNTDSGSNEEMDALEFKNLPPVERRLSIFDRRLSVYCEKTSNGPKKPLLTYTELNKQFKERELQKKREEIQPELSLNPFVELIQLYLKKYSDCDPVESFGLPLLPAHAPKLNCFTDFILGPFKSLCEIPDPKSSEGISLIRIFCFALRQESFKELRFEAAHLIVTTGYTKVIGRWDTYILKQTLSDMLISENEKDKDVAAFALFEMNLITEQVIDHLKTGFGDINVERRQKMNACISQIDLTFAPLVIQMLIQESKNVNFRIRLDVIHQLCILIQRLTHEYQLNETFSVQSLQESQDLKKSFTDVLNPKESDTSVESIRTLEDQQDHVEQEEQANQLLLDNTNDNPSNTLFKALDTLLKLMWKDWSTKVRDTASIMLGKLGKGRAIFSSIIQQLISIDPIVKIDALKCLTFLGVMTPEGIPLFLSCLKDPYSSVREEACRTACAIQSDHPSLIHELLDNVDDVEWRVRAFAIKALGLSHCKAPKNRTTLHWTLLHDPAPSVRAETIFALRNLGFLQDDQVREWVSTVQQMDSNEQVRQLADSVLKNLPIKANEKDGLQDSMTELNKGHKGMIAPPSLPYPHILNGRSDEEIKIFLRDSLIEDKEHLDVIHQVKLLADKDTVMRQVLLQDRLSDKMPTLNVDLNLLDGYKKSIKSRPRIPKELR